MKSKKKRNISGYKSTPDNYNRRILCYVYRRNGIPGWRIFKDTDIL